MEFLIVAHCLCAKSSLRGLKKRTNLVKRQANHRIYLGFNKNYAN